MESEVPVCGKKSISPRCTRLSDAQVGMETTAGKKSQPDRPLLFAMRSAFAQHFLALGSNMTIYLLETPAYKYICGKSMRQ